MAHRVYAVPAPVGALSLMPCPPADDVTAVLQGLDGAGVTTVVSMLPQDEAMDLGLSIEADICASLDIEFLSHPIEDFGLPDLETFVLLIDYVAQRMSAGGSVAVHCRAGIGRSGMVAACTLIALGKQAAEAQDIVTAARGVSIPDTVNQAKFIRTFAARWRAPEKAERKI